MRRFTTLSILAIFAPAMALIMVAVYTVLEVIHQRRRTAKYRHNLPRSVARSLQEQQDADIMRMIRTGATR